MSNELNHIIKNMQGSIENRLKAAYNLGRREGYEAGINEVEAYHMGYQQGREDGLTGKHWGKQTDEIKVGDEVVSDAFDDKGIVTHITDDKASCVSIICSGSSMMRVGIHGLHKTGRHFPQIAEVLKQMQEDKTE